MPTEKQTPDVRILAVDDCPMQRQLLTYRLEAAGYSVLVVETGQQALDAARSSRFDAVILDVNMPGMNGCQVGRALRADPATRSAMIAMHTSEDEAAVRTDFGGFDEFLPKPAAPALLEERIGRMIRQGRLGCDERQPRYGESEIGSLA